MGGKGWSRVGAWGILSLVSRWRPKACPKPDQLAPNESWAPPLGAPKLVAPMQRSGIGPKPQARRAHPLSCSSRSTWRRPRDARAPKGA